MDPTQKQPAPPAVAWQDEGFDFELTDFDEARRVLDHESISQFDVASIASPEQWKRLRRETRPTDRALSGPTIDWLLGLSPDLRPEKLGQQFPRIANALAEVWHDADAREAALDNLVASERRGRAGFPPDVQRELKALRRWTIGLRGWNQPF